MKKYSIKPTVLIKQTLLAAAVGLALSPVSVLSAPSLVHCSPPSLGAYVCAPGTLTGDTVGVSNIDLSIKSVNVVASFTDNARITVSSGGIVEEGVIIASNTGSVMVNIAGGGQIQNKITASSTGGVITIENAGTITGMIDLSGNNSIINNNSAWVINDGVNTTVNSQFGGSGTFNNNGTISLDSGVTEGELTGLSQFINTGTIQLFDGVLGDKFIINGDYVANGGLLILDTKLNAGGGLLTETDTLQINGNVSVGGAATQIRINNVDGLGELTGSGPTDGIQIIEFTGTTIDPAAFVLENGHTRAGAYSYYLFGESAGWYLRSRIFTPDGDQIAYSPELGAYLSNRDSVISLFNHSLHDRIGEPRYTQTRAGQDEVPSVWLRVAGNQVNRDMSAYSLDVRTNTYLTQLGGEIASWQKEGNRLHLGLMGGMGNSSSKVHANYDINNEAKGEVRGYSVGAYATWYGNQGQQTGAYVDSWVQYGWYRNKVNSNSMIQERYNSNLWTVSVESGYAMLAHEYDQTQVMLEPQAQVTYHNYRSKDHTDSQNLRVSDSNTQGVETRLGVRAYLREKQLTNPVQPFIETNWLYRNTRKDMKFDEIQFSGEIPKNRLEIKVGLQSEASKNVQLYAHLGQQFGKDDYRRTEGAVGVKILF